MAPMSEAMLFVPRRPTGYLWKRPFNVGAEDRLCGCARSHSPNQSLSQFPCFAWKLQGILSLLAGWLPSSVVPKPSHCRAISEFRSNFACCRAGNFAGAKQGMFYAGARKREGIFKCPHPFNDQIPESWRLSQFRRATSTDQNRAKYFASHSTPLSVISHILPSEQECREHHERASVQFLLSEFPKKRL